MAGILSAALNALMATVNPKKRSEVTQTTFENLNKKTALILFAVAEAVLGEGFLLKAPRFIETVDDFLNYQKRAQREQFVLAFLVTEKIPALTIGKLQHFSHLSLADRRKVLDKLRSGSQQQRNIYAALINVSAATYYSSDLSWPDLNYPGVSVDHPEILNQPPPIPWRPTDPRPIEE